ncbi:tRNA glutamyl-Q(34) synthetase GluQRS [Maritimibacter dapengensis]|uniref:tRNA glutamyl-Q(34) synthetase GluQRS n=1 Tax=Maritimibacter dapengensis TaxID=2836868 RepID=A0ABS6T3D2_9RHOB|nr:tRNA glutamyl-Q(34) synthetase GluQRS [Maritimibacter dapengensis]
MRTRFAPSPTGYLHLGHAYSALTVWNVAAATGGTAFLRIEDFDSQRCKPVYEQAIYDDLAWLGLDWPTPVRRASDHVADYDAVLADLAERGLLYPCSCSRSDIKHAGGTAGWDGIVYPGTCRARSMSDVRPGDALRLNLAAAIEAAGPLPAIHETGPLQAGTHTIDPQETLTQIGDPVLKRRETGDPAYHLVVTHDDAVQEMTHVVRGADLWHAISLHVVIQSLMDWPVPTYHHHDLIRDEAGERLAKISHSKAIRAFRDEGATPADLRRIIGL